MKFFQLKVLAFALAAVLILSAGFAAAYGTSAGRSADSAVRSAARAAAPAAAPADDQPDPALVAKGKARYQAYRCFDCHGKDGEGTDDAPDLIGTHLDAAGIAKFLDKPSADAQAKGMPSVPAGSDDSKALVAFVLSIKKAK